MEMKGSAFRQRCFNATDLLLPTTDESTLKEEIVAIEKAI
jgi:hypothetical protein